MKTEKDLRVIRFIQFHLHSNIKYLVCEYVNDRCCIDMIFNEDAILLQLFNIYEDEQELKEQVLKYCHGGVMEMARPAVIDASKTDQTELDMVRAVKSREVLIDMELGIMR